MKNIIISTILLFISSFVFSQTEVDEKTRKRNERFTPQTSNNNDSQVIIVPNNPNIIYPYNNFYNPYNPYGYNNRFNGNNNINYYRNSRLQFSTGITSGIGKYPYSLGGYFTIGSDRSFFIFSYESSKRLPYDRGNTENRTLWDNITRDEAIFWDDEELDRFLRYSSFNLGFGGSITDRLSPFVSVNFYIVDGEFVYYDETGALGSPNNQYTIHDTFEDGINLTFGTFYRIHSVQLGGSFTAINPARLNAHLGFIF